MTRTFRTVITSLLCASLVVQGVAGCSSRSTSRTTTTELETADPDRARYAYGDDDRVVTRSETTTIEDRDDGDGGLFSIVGDVIALPFRAVGALLSAIF